jgi:hypothetical protein
MHDLKFNNVFSIEQIRDGKIIMAEDVHNAVTTPGINSILNVYFGGTESIQGAWYLGLIDHDGFTSTADADTMASHSGWTEFTNYSETVRQTWAPTLPPTNRSITGANVSAFTIGTVAAGKTLQGIFVGSSATKGGVTGLLWASALFSQPAGIITGDIFRATYTLRLANS